VALVLLPEIPAPDESQSNTLFNIVTLLVLLPLIPPTTPCAETAAEIPEQNGINSKRDYNNLSVKE
jgi:hypothetical protein